MGGGSIPQPSWWLSLSCSCHCSCHCPHLEHPNISSCPPFPLGPFPRAPSCSSGSEHGFLDLPFPGTQAVPCCSCSRAGVQDVLLWLLRGLGSCCSLVCGCSMVRDPWGTEQTSVGVSGICGRFNKPQKASLRAGKHGMDSAL